MCSASDIIKRIYLIAQLANTDEVSDHLPLQTQLRLGFNNTYLTRDSCMRFNKQFPRLN